MATIDIQNVRTKEVLDLLSTKDKSDFISYHIHVITPGTSSVDFFADTSQVTKLEDYLFTNDPSLWKAYVLDISGVLSSRIYNQFKDTDDSEDIAVAFYYSLLRCSYENRLNSLLNVLVKKVNEEYSNKSEY